ncbi:mucin-2 [Xiphophorus couchianus]|uniref:mucin-2 n=1 Tax=Xiphophorus couchianus TaxID=32473 RepID=UPI00101625E0|nr:otogelin [Xiphophorus couchianus]
MRWRSALWSFLVLSVTTFSEVQTTLVSNHVSSICSTWGRDHFKTFDGDVYQFPGMCEYNLISNCHDSYQLFSVHIKKAEKDGNPTISYLAITINELLFHISKSWVTVNYEKVPLPYYKAGVQVKNNAAYIKFQSKLGFTVMWNGEDAVMVEIDADFANRTCGLCGDFNGVPVYNEFILHDRKISPIEFGNKYKAHHPNDECEDPYEEELLEDVTVSDSCKEFLTVCENMFLSESWSSCTKLINPEVYIQACVKDMCGCKNNTNDFCACSTLSEFSRQCSHAGGQPPNWRTTQFCAKECPYNMVYEESGSPCMDTCTHQDTSSLCEDHKMDGCFCPSGTVFDDISERGCIPQSECQCKHDKIYSPGEVYRQDQEECTCFEGMWDCITLETPATCAVEQGSYFTTFDGKTYTFHGDCYYTLAKVESKDGASPNFTLLAQLVPCAHQQFDTCLKSLKILLNNDRNSVLSFTSDGVVQQNMQTVTLPYQSGDIDIFHASSFHIMLQTRFGLQIQIQHVPLMQVYISLEQSYRSKTRGLCGNFNMILSDEMKTPQGIVEGTAATFSNSWKANLMCSDTEERLDDPCSLSLENEMYAKHWCALLVSPDSAFAQCRSVVDPEMFHKRCIYSTCSCEKSEACLCAVFSSYARACAEKGVFLTNWRENVCDTDTKSCPASQTFSYTHQRCQLTCRSLSSEQQSCTSDFLPVDGCSCAEGLYLNENGLCVPVEKCSCFYNDNYINPGTSINIRDEHCVCNNGILHCRSWRSRVSLCPYPKVFFNCSSATAGELGLKCAKACSNLESDECVFTECESGCRCPEGLLEDGKGNCVKEADCPCKHNGHIFAPGAVIPNLCNTCNCKSGKWQCTEKKCPASCIIYGSGHYNTFDQRPYGFQGECGYIAVANKCGNKTAENNFGVITENVPCGSSGTTCSKTVRIQLGRTEIKLMKGKYVEEDLGHGVLIQYRIRRVGLYLVVESKIGLAVIWDRKTAVRILLEPQHSGSVCGLCGNFDGNGPNDFTTQGQLVVSNPLEFANSWKVQSTCPDKEEIVDSCVAAPMRHQWAKMMCSIVTGETFKDCHYKVDPRPFYDNCVKDSCACDTGGDCECFCSAVAAYAQACNEAGVCVSWRTPDICPVFCDYYNNPDDCTWHYSPCHTPCYKTCLNPQGICNNPIPNLEGCYPVCPEDKPIFDEKNQTCVEECAYCLYNGTIYEDNDVIYNVTDNMGMCYYAICINTTVIRTSEPCVTSPTTTSPMETTTLESPTTTKVTTPPTTTPSATPEPSTTTTTPPTTTTTTTTPPTTTTEPTTTTTTPPTTTTGPTTTTTTTPPTTTPETTTTTTTSPPTTTTEYPTTTTTTPPTTTTEPTTTTKTTTAPPTTTTTEPPTTTTTTLPTTTPETTTTKTTTECSCVFNGSVYQPGDEIFVMYPIGSGICLTMICSDVCEIHNNTEMCGSTSTPSTTSTLTPTPTPTPPTCEDWGVVQNETFFLCNCTMARCIENNTIEIIPYECPPLQNITCANEKKPVLAYDEYHCCQQYVCDCVCEGWGDPHYITFDGLYYSYQGNCTYVLMEEIKAKYHLKIYVDNVFCDPTEDVSCPRSIIIAYGFQVVTLINHNLVGAPQLEVMKSGEKLKLPYAQQGIKIMSSGINLVYEIPVLNVVVTFGMTGFSVNLPYQYFGSNTEGHCGTCTNNQADDCKLPTGELLENCAVMADYWPANDIYQPNCPTPPVVPTQVPEPPLEPTPCKPESICDLLKSSVFAECHPLVSPDNFYRGCVYDSCHVSNPAVECTSLQTYAAACAQAGICIRWRNHTKICATDCPSDKVYKPCGPAEQPTCEDNADESTTKFITEGCFCPDGMKLFNKDSGICVEKCGCLDPEGIPREFDERFEYKCQDCICEESTKTVICKPKTCPAPPTANCTDPGFVVVNQTNPADPCCYAYICQCDMNRCPGNSMNCPVGYKPVISVPEGKCCPEHTCEPKRVCVHKNVEYQPGSSVPVTACQDCTCSNEVDPKSGLFKIVCVFQQCKETCEPGYEYVETNDYDCCGKCVQKQCVLNLDGTMHLLNEGETWSPPENLCEHYTCMRSGDTLTALSSHIICPVFQESNCQPGTIQTAANGCCKTCVEINKACKLVSMKTRVFHHGCQSEHEVEIPYCEGSCNTFTKYSEAAAAMEHSCSCCKETRSSNRTVDLLCLNGDKLTYTYIYVEECSCGQTECTTAGLSARRKRSSTLL